MSNAFKCHYVDIPFKWGPNATEFLVQIHNGAVHVAYSDNENWQVKKDCTDFVKGVWPNLQHAFPSMID